MSDISNPVGDSHEPVSSLQVPVVSSKCVTDK